MSEFKEYVELLGEHSELVTESNGITKKFYALYRESLGPSNAVRQQRDFITEERDDLLDRHERLVVKSDKIIRKHNRLLGRVSDPHLNVFEGHDKLIKERDELLNRNEELSNKSCSFFSDLFVSETFSKLTKRKETDEMSTTIKTALYFGYVLGATLVYFMS